MRALDHVLPDFDVRECHELTLPCDPARAVEAALRIPAAPDWIVRVLFRLRGLPPATTVEELFARMGFEVLSGEPDEVVFGVAGTPWRPSGGIGPLADASPGMVRIAADLRAVPARGGCVLSTETRIQAVDLRGRRAFRRYWRLVGPFSGLIRRRWLRAAAVETTVGSYGPRHASP
ncbi:MAG: hypothetical protein ACR2HI_07695 [Gaiella sp.]